MLYIAYGSNMVQHQMDHRCPDATLVGIGDVYDPTPTLIAEGYIDTGVKIIIGVVIGGVILAGLYALFSNTVIPTMQTKIGGFFNYSGT